MKAWKNYFLTMQDVVQKVLDTQEENIMQGFIVFSIILNIIK